MNTAATSQSDEDIAEIKMAWRLVILILVTLLLVKPLGGVAYVGAIDFTIAAGLQLYLPIWRMDSLKRHYDFLGLHTDNLRNAAFLQVPGDRAKISEERAASF